MEGTRREYGTYRRSQRINRGSYRHRGSYRGNYKYYSQRPYKTDKRNSYRKKDNEIPLRPTSPVEGTEEYMTRKIQKTSAIIMEHLLSPNDPVTSNTIISEQPLVSNGKVTEANTSQTADKTSNKVLNKTKKVTLSAKEIHDKIIKHITNLNIGRKKNFIDGSNNSGLDNAINQMQKRKRLEISRILRDMGTGVKPYEDGNQVGNCINSIVPDTDIKIEDLPRDIIEELWHTLNLDIEHLNEVIGESPNPSNCEDAVTISSRDSEDPVVPVKTENVDSVEIKAEDISDIFEEEVPAVPQPLPETMASESAVQTEINTPENENTEIKREILHDSLNIKEESPTYLSPEPSVCSKSSTVVFQNNESKQPDVNHDSNESEEVNELNTNNLVKDLESTILQYVEKDSKSPCTEIDSSLRKLDILDLCVRHLTNYRRTVTQSIVTLCRRNSLTKKEETPGLSQNSKPETVVTRSSQTECIDENREFIKKRKFSDMNQGEVNEVKSEVLEPDSLLKLPKIPEKVIGLERVDNELLLATNSGKIIFTCLIDGTISDRLDVTSCAITSMSFVRGVSSFVYMYVGCLENVLRIYDLKGRRMLKATLIDDQIRCMDSKWDYVFMGCKHGTLMRYSCNKERIEFEDKNMGSDILVLKAAQEGPRRVLLIGHRHAPIYMRDAMSGLYLRNFSNEAVTPTVYSLAINQSNLYCGTAKDNILVFSFHEGHLTEKITADNSKGISCLKILKNLLFAGCYNGSIYVYNLEQKRLLTILKGPGGSIVCMEVLSNQVIVGTLTGQLDSLSLPSDTFLTETV